MWTPISWTIVALVADSLVLSTRAAPFAPLASEPSTFHEPDRPGAPEHRRAMHWIRDRNSSNATVSGLLSSLVTIPLTTGTAPLQTSPPLSTAATVAATPTVSSTTIATSTSKPTSTSTSSAAGSLHQTSAATKPTFGSGPMGGLQIANPNNFNCSSIPDYKGPELWKRVNGSQVMTSFESMLHSNALICTECFGQSKANCNSTSSDCAMGLADLATGPPPATGPRWDEALARFSLTTSDYGVNCEIGSTQCDDAPACADTSGPGAWAIWEQMVNLHDVFAITWTAIGNAGQQVESQSQPFLNQFDPTSSMDMWSVLAPSLMTGVLSMVLGVIPGFQIFGVIAGGAISMMVDGVITSEFFHQPSPPDVSSFIGQWTNSTQLYFTNLASNLFTSGSNEWKSPDGKKTTMLSLDDLFKGGTYLGESVNNATFLAQVVPQFTQILLQALVSYTWQNLESDGASHLPFIVFDNVPCDKVNPSDSNGLAQLKWGQWGAQPFQNIHSLDTEMTLNGKCYYLLDGKYAGQQETGGRGQTETLYACTSNTALPGGTNADMQGNSATLAGVTLADFITPSVGGWQANGKKNGFPTLASQGLMVNNTQTAGALNFTVCDFLTDPNNPGFGCPILDNLPSLQQGSACSTVPFPPPPAAATSKAAPAPKPNPTPQPHRPQGAWPKIA